MPFRNIIYIGDSDTDVPCMKLVSANGGYSIGVHGQESKNKVFKMIEENRIKYFAEADYSEGSELESLIKTIIDRTVVNEILEMKHATCVQEMELERKSKDRFYIQKEDLIDKWYQSQIRRIFDIAKSNSQVKYILDDKDVKKFYDKLKRMNSKMSK